MAHPSALLLGPQGFARSRGLCYLPYLPAGLSSAAAGERDRDQDHDGFHFCFTSFVWFGVGGSFSPALACFEELPASLAATATSEGDCDQDHDEFQHGSPHRLGVRFRLSFLALTRALTGTG